MRLLQFVPKPTTFSWVEPIKEVLGKYEKVEDSISSGICGQCGSKIVDKSHIEQAKAELNGFYTNLVEQAEEVGFTFPALGESCEFVFKEIETVLERNEADNLHYKEQADKHEAKAEQIRGSIETIQSAIDKKVLEQSNARDKVAKHLEKSAEYDKQIGSIEGIKGLIVNLKEQKQANRNASEELDAELETIPVKTTTELETELQGLAQTKQECNDSVDKLTRDMNSIESDIATRKKLEGEIQKFGTDVDTAKVEMETYRLASDALAPRGGRQLLLDTKLKVIELHTIEILKQMGAKERIIIDTQTDTGQETLAIMVSSESLRPLETYSKGEQTKIH